MIMVLRRRICQTTASLSAPPAADKYTVFQRPNKCGTTNVWDIGLLLLQDSDCVVSQQNYDNLTSPSDNSVGR